LLIHERGTRESLYYPRPPSLQSSISMWKQSPKTEEGTRSLQIIVTALYRTILLGG
jgi:hypothetical protein